MIQKHDVILTTAELHSKLRKALRAATRPLGGEATSEVQSGLFCAIVLLRLVTLGRAEGYKFDEHGLTLFVARNDL